MINAFFISRLYQMIDLRHSWAVLAYRIPWRLIMASRAQGWARQVKGRHRDEDLYPIL